MKSAPWQLLGTFTGFTLPGPPKGGAGGRPRNESESSFRGPEPLAAAGDEGFFVSGDLPMRPTNDLNVLDPQPLLTPAELKAELPISDEAAGVVSRSRGGVRGILRGR